MASGAVVPDRRAGGEPAGQDAQRQALLAGAFDAAPSGLLLIDAGGAIVAANGELEKMFGHARGTLVGQSAQSLMPTALRDARTGSHAGLFEQPESRDTGAGRILNGRHADGHEFPVEVRLAPLADGQGTLVLASVVDVSERLALEDAFRGLFDACPYGLLVVDDDGQVLMANRVLGESLGYSVDALVGRPMDYLLPQRYRDRHGAMMAAYRKTGEARMMGQGRDLTALHADGTELPVEVGLSRVRWQRRTVTVAVMSDISVRKRLELELRQANANLQEFTYVASHDLRSPLRGIADLVEWITADLGETPPPEVRRNLSRIDQRIQRMERLIDDLLSYARAGRAATEFTLVDLGSLVDGILEMQPVPPGFVVELGLDVPPFQATRTPLETALRNLLSNAVKHHDRGRGRLQVRARHDDSHCEISVTDDGPGVPAQARERIFKLFQTLTASERGSSGIGLALTKRVIEVHGGRIEVISPVEDGRGACFRFWWPRFPRRTSDG